MLEQIAGLGGAQTPESVPSGGHEGTLAGPAPVDRDPRGTPLGRRVLWRYLGRPHFVTHSGKSSDRRRGQRVPLSTAISGLDPRTTTPVSDLSETGCFVHTDEPLEIGATIDLRFTVFPEEPVLFHSEGRVVRHAVDGESPGMGVEFVELSDAARDTLHKIFLRHEASRQRRRLAKTDDILRTHGLVARLLDDKNKTEG